MEEHRIVVEFAKAHGAHSAPPPFTILVDVDQSTMKLAASIYSDHPAMQITRANRRARDRRQELVIQWYHAANADRYRAEGRTLGTEHVRGSAVITINLEEIRHLVARAAHNKNHKATNGPVTVEFSGSRTFVSEVAPAPAAELSDGR